MLASRVYIATREREEGGSFFFHFFGMVCSGMGERLNKGDGRQGENQKPSKDEGKAGEV